MYCLLVWSLLFTTPAWLPPCRSEAVTLKQVTAPGELGEGPHWDSTQQVLYYVDIDGKTLHRFDPSNRKNDSVSFSKKVTLVLPVRGHSNKFIIALDLDLVLLTWDWVKGISSQDIITSVDQGHSGNLFNDGKADAWGRVWAGTKGPESTPGSSEPNMGSLYRLSSHGECRGLAEIRPVTISNGLAWNSDNTVFYFIDMPTRRVDAYEYNVISGDIFNRRTVFEFGEEVQGDPDGMTFDVNNNLWIACHKGSQVIHVDPSNGKLLGRVVLPVTLVTSVVFGGASLDTLYVTTMRSTLSPQELRQQPLAGSVFAVTGLNTTGTLSKPAILKCRLPSPTHADTC